MKNITRRVSHVQTDPYQPVLKASALLELRDALIKERYEDCPAIITLAKEFGATREEVRDTVISTVQGKGS